MEAETTYRITVSEKDTEVLGELIAILDGCPVELSNDDYVEIIRARIIWKGKLKIACRKECLDCMRQSCDSMSPKMRVLRLT